MTANSNKSKQGNKAAHRVIAGVLCGASVLSLVLSLVMPPISQAIANDAQMVSTEGTVMGGGSSSESTDVDNTTNGDTENQNSDDAEGGEADPSNGVEQGQPEGKLQAEDVELSDGNAVMLAAEGGQTETASTEIRTADELKKLANVSGVVSFKLMNDIDTSEMITLSKDASNITLDLNGCKIKHASSNQPLFNITGGATLTVKDSRQVAAAEITTAQTNKYGNLASMGPDTPDGIPTSLTYYVTKSDANGTSTTETLKAYRAGIAGAIVACGGKDAYGLKLVNLFNGGHFNLESGVLTQKKDEHVANLIYAENGSIVNMSGGYVCGASTGASGTGAGVMVSNTNGSASTLNLTGGVIAGNYAPNGGGVYANGSTINMSDGTIAGNGTFDNQSGYGAGIYALNSTVDISNGYITNNRYQYYANNEGSTKHLGNGCHGGGGIAAFNGGSLKINGGYITGNYSAEAGGGIYAGAWNQALSTFTFSGGTIASNVAQNSEGGGIRIAAPTVGDFNVVSGKKAYITNNTTNTTNDWGGGGVFVQGGNSGENVNSASLKIYNALITNNRAEGFGGGFAACPSGKTAITDTNGIAIYDNTDNNGHNRSGGTNGKSEDWDADPNGGENGGEITPAFIKAGHQDLFLIHDSSNFETNPYIAAVTGQMLGGGAANWSGTIDKKTPTSIGKYEGAQAKYLIGLKSDPIKEDKDAATAAATLYITGNKSNIHGGGIMTNGDVVAGSTKKVKVYPKMKLNGTKELTGRTLKEGEFEFQLLKPGKDGKAPGFNDGKLQLNDCSVVDTVENDEKGNFTFDLGEVYADDALVYYLVEVPGTDKDKGVAYDETIYKIDPTVVEDTGKSHYVLGIKYEYYKVDSVSVTRVENDDAGARTSETESAAIAAAEGENAATITLTKGATFTNTYTSSGSWTPQVTKKVDGGEMKKFKFELFTKDNGKEKVLDRKWTADGSSNSQAVTFAEQKIGPLNANDFTDGKATITYYIRECAANDTDGTKHEGYTNDTKTFKVVVTATDNGNGTLTCTPAYYEVDANGNVSSTSTDNPTFTNTYSTSLPLSGMSGVTLTYLAGAAVLCAAAAWMHIRRKANAKGGERRE